MLRRVQGCVQLRTYLVTLGGWAGSNDAEFSEGVVETAAEEVEVGRGTDSERNVQVAVVANEDVLWLAVSVQVGPLGRGGVSSRHISASAGLGDGEVGVSTVGVLAGASSGASIAALNTVEEVYLASGRVEVGTTAPVQPTGVIVDAVARAQGNAVRRDWGLNLSLAGSNTVVPSLSHLGVSTIVRVDDVSTTAVGVNISGLVQSVVHVNHLDLPGGTRTLSLLNKAGNELVVLNDTSIVG